MKSISDAAFILNLYLFIHSDSLLDCGRKFDSEYSRWYFLENSLSWTTSPFFRRYIHHSINYIVDMNNNHNFENEIVIISPSEFLRKHIHITWSYQTLHNHIQEQIVFISFHPNWFSINIPHLKLLRNILFFPYVFSWTKLEIFHAKSGWIHKIRSFPFTMRNKIMIGCM